MAYSSLMRRLHNPSVLRAAKLSPEFLDRMLIEPFITRDRGADTASDECFTVCQNLVLDMTCQTFDSAEFSLLRK